MNIQTLQIIIINALNEIKAQEIRIFNTTHLTTLFERITIASGSSNRQTKALAALVCKKVKLEGGKIFSIEGQDTGEWILVDLGNIIVHIMQPNIRMIYRLEEIWGDQEININTTTTL